MNIKRILEENVKEHSQKTAVIFKDRIISFGQLREASFKLADSLTRIGIKKGDKVAGYLPNGLEYIFS